jgi:hypothetical protein
MSYPFCIFFPVIIILLLMKNDVAFIMPQSSRQHNMIQRNPPFLRYHEYRNSMVRQTLVPPRVKNMTGDPMIGILLRALQRRFFLKTDVLHIPAPGIKPAADRRMLCRRDFSFEQNPVFPDPGVWNGNGR